MSSSVNALYRIFDADDELLYIGITNNPRGRAMDHARTKPWARRIAYITFEHFGSRDELLVAERAAVASEGPTFNVSHNRGDGSTADGDWELAEYDGPDPAYTADELAENAAAAAAIRPAAR